MESPPPSTGLDGESFDPSKPFQGLVVCCTSIEADQRTEIAVRVTDMGGHHKYDLTPDVTHLIVGDYNTAKYRHVAKERPDIKPMAAGWIDAVRTLWLEDREMDFAALESKWQLRTFEAGGGIPNSPHPQERERIKLVCCLTGFEDNSMRSMIEDKVINNGGEFIPDLSRRVTHLITHRPEGKKYLAAKRWGICTVSIEWLHDSVERGMILNEECYDPTLPPEERGQGAWTRKELRRVSTGKRLRDGSVPAPEAGRRKLRKTASMKLTSQSDNLWGDILVKQSSVDQLRPKHDERAQSVPSLLATDSAVSITEKAPPAIEPDNVNHQAHREGVFSHCWFFVSGFPKRREELVCHHLTSHGGQISPSLADAASLKHAEPLESRYLVVPQTSQPDTHPQLPEGLHIVTEFFIERCIHNRTLFSPNEHVLGQPFPRFPIDGFQNLIICTTGFKNEQLNQMEKTITQLGAKYSERFNSHSSLLLCPALQDVRKQKLDYAMLANIPVVDAEWLWQCITTGCLVPWDKFLFKELGQKFSTGHVDPKRKEKDPLLRTRSEPVPKRPNPPNPKPPHPPSRAGIDTTAFDDDVGPANASVVEDSMQARQEAASESHYDTAPTHLAESIDTAPVPAPAPLSEAKSNALNKSPPSRKLKRFPTGGEIGDSDDSDASAATATVTRQKLPKATDTATASAEARRQEEAERERRRMAEEAQAAERKKLSDRLNSLMSPHDGEATTAVAGGNHSGASAEGGLKPLPSAAAVGAGAAPPRRKREIFGRAASNVSAASSGSVESSSGAPGGRLNMTKSTGGEAEAEAEAEPPATQIEYDNPEARKHRARVMDRMMGHSHNAGAGEKGGKKSEEKVRMGMGMGMGMGLSMSVAGSEMGTGTGGGAGKRSMRRR
ncbi:BRCT domain-containing protein [Biscogniauxia sp. FL1348]|nr:BRCT domain-containing protein [Biscogniauxia sp. FL1348]